VGVAPSLLSAISGRGGTPGGSLSLDQVGCGLAQIHLRTPGNSVNPLHEHPTMALWVFGAVALPILVRFDVGDDGGTLSLRLREVGIDIVDVNQHPVDDVGHRRPLLRRLPGNRASAWPA